MNKININQVIVELLPSNLYCYKSIIKVKCLNNCCKENSFINMCEFYIVRDGDMYVFRRFLIC